LNHAQLIPQGTPSYYSQSKFQNFTQIIHSTSSQIHAIRSLIIMRSTYLQNVLPHNNLADTFMAIELIRTITSDPVNQAVNEGETAIFSNSAGSATTLPATLSVSARIIAPSIATGPTAQTVQAGQLGLFSITASGTSPLSYQWFKNGQPLIAANASEVLIPANAADAGTSYQISVQVSNSAGTVSSAIVSMAITAVTATNTGTLVVAAQGGFVTAGPGTPEQAAPSLSIPAGALAANTVISVTTEASSVVGLPADITPLGDVINIGPANLVFNTPAILRLPVPEGIPEGKVLALVELPASSSALLKANPANTAKSSAPSMFSNANTNLRRIAQNNKSANGVVMMAASAGMRALCAQTANQVGGSFETPVLGVIRVVLAAVPESSCTGNAPAPVQGNAPSDKNTACTLEDFQKSATNPEPFGTISRHVYCKTGVEQFYLFEGQDTYGNFEFRWYIGADGPSNRLNKTFRFKVELIEKNGSPRPADFKPLPQLTVKPSFSTCSPRNYSGTCQIVFTPKTLSVGGNVTFTEEMTLDWAGGDNTWNEIEFPNLQINWALPGRNIDSSSWVGSHSPPTLRCDKGVAKKLTNGCVYTQLPPVFVLPGDSNSDVAEAAQHIREAQASGAYGKYVDNSGGSGYPLQRAKSEVIKRTNRTASCGEQNSSLINSRQPLNQSSSCAAGTQRCSCDEYPFAATWNGGNFRPDKTSVKRINFDHNQNAGNQYGTWLLKERVLDFTNYACEDGNGIFCTYDPNLESNRSGDNFWILIR
jgi:VCBS repeat-containing protein